jgi:hypothetical protein
MTKKTVNEAPSGRPKRKPVGYRNRLLVENQDPDYQYRWVNTNFREGMLRVQEFEEAGYEKVLKHTVDADTGRIEGSSLGSFQTAIGGAGDVMILMRQKKEYFEEDQKAKQKAVDETDQAQKRTPDGFYGKITDKA